MAVRGGGGHLKQQIKNRTATIKKTKIISQESVTDGNNLCKYTSLGSSLLWFQPHSGHVRKPSSAYGWSGGFSLDSPVFCQPLMNDCLAISKIFLKGL